MRLSSSLVPLVLVAFSTAEYLPLSQKANARQFITTVEQKIGRKLTSEEIDRDFRKFSERLPTVGGPEQINEIRIFVKMVGPLLKGKPEYGTDAPLHDVLIRADDILGMPDDPDQDAHPHVKGMAITKQVKEFLVESIKYWHLRPKDEL